MEKLFFKSDIAPSHWDTWLYYNEGKFYLYYLAEDKGHWGGFGVAVSGDGVSWEDHGLKLVSSDKRRQYLGTGSVWKSQNFLKDKTFICNYSEWQTDDDGVERQRIFFATSKNLIDWEKCGEETVFKIDTALYERDGRWDCIYPIPYEDGYYGTWTATPKGRANLQGGIGFGKSADGIHWQALQTNGVFPDADESGAVVEIDGRFYAMFGRGGRMVGYSSDAFNGPYKECSVNPVMLADYTYFSRFFLKEGKVLVNHHAITRFKSKNGIPITYMAPLKELCLEKGGMWLKYWKGNDKLKYKKEPCGKLSSESAILEGRLKDGETVKIYDGEDFAEVIFSDNCLTVKCGGEIKRTSREIGFGTETEVKVLLKESVFEVYFNDYYMASYSLKSDITEVSGSLLMYQIKD